MSRPCEPPPKPLKVPNEARWFGGCDGGNWIELISIVDNKYRFRIYQDWSGELEVDEEFVPEGCNGAFITLENWKGTISHFDQDGTFNYITTINGKCKLKSTRTYN